MFCASQALVRPMIAALVVTASFFVHAPSAIAYELPVDAPISDPWRAPVHEYAPGNRGVAFSTSSGSNVVASEAGVVSFAGQVAGNNYVVVDHPDGLRSTYGGLASVRVGVGQRIAAKAPVGLAGLALHFGVRRGDAYLNPMILVGQRSRLVPLDAPDKGPRGAISPAAFAWTSAAASRVADRAMIPVSADNAGPAALDATGNQSSFERWVLLSGIGLLLVGLGRALPMSSGVRAAITRLTSR